MSTEATPEVEPSTLPTQDPSDSIELEAEDQLSAEPTTADGEQEPWTRYGIHKAFRVDLKNRTIDQQSVRLAEHLRHQDLIAVIGRDCGAPIRDLARSAAFKRADELLDDRPDVFVLRLDEDLFNDEEIQRPQKIEAVEEALKVLPSAALVIDGIKRSIICVEFSMDEPPGFVRSLLGTDNLIDHFTPLLQRGQQIVFVLDLKAQERIPSSAQEARQGVLILDWVEPLLNYYNEKWDLEPSTISKAVHDLKLAFASRAEREATLYGTIYALKGNSFRGGSTEFEDCIREAISESQKTGETIAQLGNYFSSGNRIEQTILALAAFGPTMSHRTFATLGARFLPNEKIPIHFLPEHARVAAEDGNSGRSQLTWTEAWRDNLDHYRNKLKVTIRNQEIELRVNRDLLREHLLESYPAGLHQILQAIPHVLQTENLDRDLEESAIRLLIRLAVTDQRSYDRSWYVKSLLEFTAPAPSNLKQSSSLFRLSTALRVLDEQTSEERSGFGAAVFEELVRTLRKQSFPAVAIAELCKRLDPDRFRTQTVLESLLHSSTILEFKDLLENLGLTSGKRTPTQRLGLMLAFANHLRPAEEYRSNLADHKARRALWLWNVGLRSDRFPMHIPYRKISLHQTFAREFFLASRETAEKLLRGVLNFDPRALAFAGRNRRDLRRWLENITAIVIRADDADTNSLVVANKEALVQQVSDCITTPLFGLRSRDATVKLNAFDELEPPELWRDVYSELDGQGPEKSTFEFAERLLLLPLVARSALIAEWFLQLEYATHSIPKANAYQLRDGALSLLLSMRDQEPIAAHLADDFDYLAGIAAQLAAWSLEHVEDPRLTEMYDSKRVLLEYLTASVRH